MDTYEKKYNEALSKCKAYIDDTEKRWSEEFSRATEEVFKEIFPELRESEDERTRKDILKFFQVCANERHIVIPARFFEYIEKQKEPVVDKEGMYYYLGGKFIYCGYPVTEENPYDFAISQQEKQKEQEPVPTEEEREYVKTLKGLISDFVRDCGGGITDVGYYQRISDWLDGRHIEQKPEGVYVDCTEHPEWYGMPPKEQKPASTEDMPYITDEHFYEREPADSFKYKLAEYMTKCCTKKEGPYGYTYGISAETILKMAEEELLKRGVVQKPAWSEEDENTLKYLHELISFGYTEKFFDAQTAADMREWLNTRLKSLRPQPKVELSEDVKKTLDEVSHILAGLNYKQVAKDYKQAVEKLLYSRPSWKPSEEQMYEFEYAISRYRDFPEREHEQKVLKSLYKDLKKLM